MKRRTFIEKMTATGIGLMAFPAINKNTYSILANTKKKYSDRAIRLVEEATVMEMLGGFQDYMNKRDGVNLTELWLSKPGSFTKEDFQKCKDSGINVFAPGEGRTSKDFVITYLARWNGFIASNSQYMERIDMPQKLDTINKSGKIGLLFSFQNSTHFEKVKDVDFFYGLGQRISQLTYNGANKLGSGCFEDEDKGLTEFGAAVVERMNTIGMAVDVSHCGDRTTLDTLSVSKRPVLITHAACRALNPGYDRAKTDEAIKKTVATGGVIGIPMLRFMIRDREPVTIEHFLDHIDHVVKLVGVEYVGIGSDQGLVTEDDMPLEWRKKRLETAPKKYKVHFFEDYLIGIEELNHAMRTFDVTEGLIRRSYSDEHIKLILGGNFKRVLQEIFIDQSLLK